VLLTKSIGAQQGSVYYVVVSAYWLSGLSRALLVSNH